jgi:hypothetical protein|tara:strand:- start:16075 stop:16278 length:204 start_codon:yes stop_codon:yes gene_type:complete
MLSGLRRQEAIFVGRAALLPSRTMNRDLSEDQVPRANRNDFDSGWQKPAMTSEQLPDVTKRWGYQQT